MAHQTFLNAPGTTPETKAPRLAWLPIPLFLVLMLYFKLNHDEVTIEAPYLLLSLNFLFSTLISFLVAALMGRSFIMRGDPGVLLVGCGVLLWGAAGFVGSMSSLAKSLPGRFDANTSVTIHNTCAWFSALLHLTGIASSIRLKSWHYRPRLWVTVAYTATIVLVSLITGATLANVMPVFFIQGNGGTPVRQLIVASTVAMFLTTAFCLYRMNEKRERFNTWYICAILLLAESMLGVLFQSFVGTGLTWVVRGAQCLAGIYMLLAARTSMESVCPFTFGRSIDYKILRIPIALVTVLGIASVRMVFFQDLGSKIPYMSFIPAVIMAALYGGIQSGLAATVISVILADLFFINRPWIIDVNASDLPAMTTFVVIGTMVSWITDRMLKTRAKLITIEAEARFAAERIRHTEKLHRAHERLSLTLTMTGLEAWNWDLGTGEFSRCSPEDATEEPVGSLDDFCAAIHDDDCERVRIALENAARHQIDFQEEFRIVQENRQRWVLSRATVFQDGPATTPHLMGINIDITERKNMECELLQAHNGLEQRVAERTAELAAMVEELHGKELLLLQQSRMAAMGEMIQNIAHQWRQPLNSLGLNVQLLKVYHDQGKLNEETLSKSVNDAMLLVQHMSATIDDFREFFRPDREKVTFKVSQVVDKTVKLVEGSFRSKRIGITVTCDDDAVCHGYPNQYAQVMLNLLNNAREAIEHKQPEAPQVRLSVGMHNGRSRVVISDNGGGIHDSILYKIFDPHFTTKGPQGTGIGLFMAKNIIERNMLGSLEVHNIDHGAEFIVEA